MLFESSFRDAIVFKGGTSLSKVFGVINRFSEDIDLSLAPAFLGLDEPDAIAALSKGQANKWMERAQATCTAVVRDKLASAEADIMEASAELDRLALRAVLAGDQSASGATARLDALRQRRDLLSRALVAAEQAERTSREALNARENQARKRAAARRSASTRRCRRVHGLAPTA